MNRKEFTYESRLAPYMNTLLEQKRTDGYRYETEAWHLKKLDEFLLAHAPDADTVTREIAALWCVKRDTEGSAFHSRRIGILRQLCICMNGMGVPAYIPKNLSSCEKPILYIPSETEIQAFFDVLDRSSQEQSASKRYGRIAAAQPLLFRLYYCCGMRLSEPLRMRKEHADADRGILTVYSSKGQKDRLVYLPEDGTEMLREYIQFLNDTVPFSSFLFPGEDPMCPMSRDVVQRRFRKYWMKIFPEGQKRPTVHCLRHAFVVTRMNDWCRNGIDTETMLPYLSSYLGHKTPSETFYYYHMADSAFSVIRQCGKCLEDTIPEVHRHEE